MEFEYTVGVGILDELLLRVLGDFVEKLLVLHVEVNILLF